MSFSQEFFSDEKMDFISLIPDQSPCIIFLYGDLGTGKTHFSSKFLSKKLNIPESSIVSPTYMYYQKYESNYHFDLYRVENYESFVQIGGEEILDNLEGFACIEWPQILENIYTPHVKIYFSECEKENMRKIRLEIL